MGLRLAIAALLLLELLACGADLLLGPWGRLHWEELFNARGGVFFACGHQEAAADLQYRTFCGGCTAEGLLAAPLFLRFGPTTLIWKLVPLGFHMLIAVFGAIAAALGARRAQGGAPEWAALAFVALTLGAPGFARDLALTGWGNHAESTAFPLVSVALLALAAPRWAGLLPLALAGVVAGLGFWFCHTSAHALPALALGAALIGGWRAPAFFAGGILGAWPWWAYHQARPEALDYTFDWWGVFDLAPPSALYDWLFGPYLRAGLWPADEYAAGPPWPTLWWLLSWAIGLYGLGLAAMAGRRGNRALAWFGPMSFAALILAYFLRHDLWSNLPDIYADATFNLRYRVPLVPMLALGGALAAGYAAGRARALVAAGIVGLCAFGLSCRVSRWEAPKHHLLELRVFQHAGWPDRTVPTGLPPERMDRARGRPADLRAALDWLSAHEDPLADCRMAHMSELGRRLGIGLDGEVGAALPAWLPEALAAASTEPERRQLAEGLGRGLTLPGDQLVVDVGDRLNQIAAVDPAFSAEVGAAAGRLVAPGWPAADDPDALASLDPRLRAGVCEGRGYAWIEARAGIVNWRSGAQPIAVAGPDDLRETGGICAATPAFWQGVGRSFARWAGCEAPIGARLDSEAGPFATHANAGWSAACAALRQRKE